MKISRPSPSLVISCLALFVALGGVGYAAATGSIDGREIKNNAVASKDVKDNSIVGKDVKTSGLTGSDVKANSLSGSDVSESSLDKVASAAAADHASTAGSASGASLLGGKSADQLQVVSTSGDSSTNVASLGTTLTTVATATITTRSQSRILASGSAELFGADGSETGACRLQIDTHNSLEYEAQPDDVGTDNEFVIAVHDSAVEPAGSHVVNLQCSAASGTVGKDDAGLNVIAVPE